MFDVNTLYAIRYSWDNSFRVFWKTDDILVIESNMHNQKRKITTKSFSFFVRREGEVFERILEKHKERGYTVSETKRTLAEAELRLVGCYECLTFVQPEPETKRVFFVSKNS